LLIVGLSGSLRRDSYNRMLLAVAAKELPPAIEFEEWRGLASIPPYNEDVNGSSPPPPVADLRRTLQRADGILVATPEYNHSVPGQLKNALDWASRPFPDNALRGKVAAVMGASTSLFGAVWAQAEVRKVLGAIGARVIEQDLAVASAHEAFGLDGSLRDAELRGRLSEIVAELLDSTGKPLRSVA